VGISDEFERRRAEDVRRKNNESLVKQEKDQLGSLLEPLARAKFREAAQVLLANGIPTTRYQLLASYNFWGSKRKITDEMHAWKFWPYSLLNDGRLVCMLSKGFQQPTGDVHYKDFEFMEILITPEGFRVNEGGEPEILVTVETEKVWDWRSLDYWLGAHIAQLSGVETHVGKMFRDGGAINASFMKQQRDDRA
jgi:hypothetical protein